MFPSYPSGIDIPITLILTKELTPRQGDEVWSKMMGLEPGWSPSLAVEKIQAIIEEVKRDFPPNIGAWEMS